MDNKERGETTMKKDRYREFLSEVRRFVPKDRIYTDELRRLCWGTDAGFYRKVPQVVIRSDGEAEVSRLLRAASRHRLPVTFRAAGTSLSGQAVGDSVLIVAGKHWEQYSYEAETGRITLQPGIVGARVNEILKPYGRKFGPDPASIGSCMVGGIVINNASGMSCGTHANSDRELVGARMILMDGTVLDTRSEESKSEFRRTHGGFVKEVEKIRDEIAADRNLAGRIRYKYSIKNVTGLNLLPFVRFTDPFDIIAHLMVGSEGTLAFLGEVTMDTLPIPAFRACAMLYFSGIREAAEAVVAMKTCEGIAAAELLDKRSLASVHDTTGPDLTAILCELDARTHEELKARIRTFEKALEPHRTYIPYQFTEDPAIFSKWWDLRAGIFPSVGGMRKEGTTCLIEDVAFHIEDLPEATADLSDLLDRHGYDDSCIYGHALEGNFHFIINQSFAAEAEIRRYEAMIRDVVDKVVSKYDGSLKAEHGTGRNMAPFVEKEWGEKAYSLMKRVKALFDPDGLLNPGVIFHDDPDCFLKDFKALPLLRPAVGKEPGLLAAFERLNKCIECGFCEVNCLSCGFTLSSRTRIVARREMARLQSTGENPLLLKKLGKQYRYLGACTCAGDGLCSMSCPMGINVADLTHEVRREGLPPKSFEYRFWSGTASHFGGVKAGLRGLLNMASSAQALLGSKAMAALCRGLHKVGIPLWTPETPKGFNPRRLHAARLTGPGASSVRSFGRKMTGNGRPAAPSGRPEEAAPKVVYFPSCINQMMGVPNGARSPDGRTRREPLVGEMTALLHKAGYEVIFPENMGSLCCGTIWESKGMPEIADRKTAEVEDALWKASGEGRWPVLCDQSPCLHRLKQKITRMKLYEPAEFIRTFLRDRLEFHRTDRPVAIHLTCSMRLMRQTDAMLDVARLCSSRVFVPEEVGCCGFAGDKGMTVPEMNAYALRKLGPQIKASGVREGYSNSRTCEIGLSHHAGIPYVSIAYLVNECTSSKNCSHRTGSPCRDAGMLDAGMRGKYGGSCGISEK